MGQKFDGTLGRLEEMVQNTLKRPVTSSGNESVVEAPLSALTASNKSDSGALLPSDATEEINPAQATESQ